MGPDAGDDVRDAGLGRSIFGGWKGKIYVISQGNLLFYQDKAQNGKKSWGAVGSKIGSGWSKYAAKVVGGWKGKIYMITK